MGAHRERRVGDVIAQDLTKMKLEASIDEADIGQVKSGQMGFFTVDSYPDTQFNGKVSQVRLEPITQQNVVTYKVVMEVDNQDLKLRPGMTASARIDVTRHRSVVRVPPDALTGGGSHATVVVRDRGGADVRRPVRVGLRGPQFVEVRSGLRAGEHVVSAAGGG